MSSSEPPEVVDVGGLRLPSGTPRDTARPLPGEQAATSPEYWWPAARRQPGETETTQPDFPGSGASSVTLVDGVARGVAIAAFVIMAGVQS